MSTPRVVIHRDSTFEADGRRYLVVGGKTPEETALYGYEIEDIEAGVREDGYSTIQDVREHVARCIETGEAIVSINL